MYFQILCHVGLEPWVQSEFHTQKSSKARKHRARVSVVFISMNKLQTHRYGHILVHYYTQMHWQGVLDCMWHRHCLLVTRISFIQLWMLFRLLE